MVNKKGEFVLLFLKKLVRVSFHSREAQRGFTWDNVDEGGRQGEESAKKRWEISCILCFAWEVFTSIEVKLLE